MLGAQALRTKQKVEQKEKERRHKDRQRNLELQRQQIQKVANEDAQAAHLEYEAKMSGRNSSPNIHNNVLPTSSSGQNFNLQAPLSERDRRNSNRKIHQRYSLSSATFHQHLRAMPMSARESQSYDRIQVPVRSPSTDFGKPFANGIDSGGHENGKSSASRFLRWIGLTSSNNSSSKHRRNSEQQASEQRRMSTY
ncbi:hypothetical protein DdX_01807 [Ditylenchus destructor]|uniref:Uncharacterized protein n=1 Tax=Ditylenchus destructor TaxID=166010 RepID=A0AAD4R8E8_9BILA|nr:hypothetical protein DdX_01807 [Ditylenchus destructor]